MAAERLDVALVERGLARSRTRAGRLIDSGSVWVDGVVARKASTRVDADRAVEVRGDADAAVGRGAVKLAAALDAFAVPVAGRIALDAGASTGGFSQVLLDRGAGLVVAVDVGHGQLAPELADRTGLVSVEGVNVRDLTPESFAGLAGGAEPPGLVVADLSFISLTTVLPALAGVAAPGADFVVLVKPQFEVGRGGVRDGIVREPVARAEAVARVLAAAWELGAGTVGAMPSPLAGARGNREFFVHVRAGGGGHPTEWWHWIRTMAGA